MRKALQTVAICAAVVSVVAAVLLAFTYLDSIGDYFREKKSSLMSRVNKKLYIG